MVTVKSEREINSMRAAGAILARTLELVAASVEPGVSTLSLDKWAEEYIRSHFGATPSFLGLYGFPASLCTSVNEEIVHGIPSDRILKDGDVISVDCGVCMNGLHADSAITVPVGTPTEETRQLLQVTREALNAGIQVALVGNYTGDIGHAIQSVADAAGCGIVRELVGHGVGYKFHEEPQIPNFGEPQRGFKLIPGMTIAIEPMLTTADGAMEILEDDWTVVTQDKSLSAHFEHTVLVTEDDLEVLTLTTEKE